MTTNANKTFTYSSTHVDNILDLSCLISDEDLIQIPQFGFDLDYYVQGLYYYVDPIYNICMLFVDHRTRYTINLIKSIRTKLVQAAENNEIDCKDNVIWQNLAMFVVEMFDWMQKYGQKYGDP